MSLIKSKQIDKVLGSLRKASSAYTLATGPSATVTTAFTGKTSGGSDTAVGVFTSAPSNRVALLVHSTGNALDDGSGNQIYGRLTFAASTWTLTYYTGNDAAYTFVAGHPALGLVIDVVYGEAIQFKDILATDVINGLDSIDETDVSPSTHTHSRQIATVTTNGQTSFTLSGTPNTVAAPVEMQVNGVDMTDRISVTGTTVTYTATDFPLETTDTVVFLYAV